VANDGSESENGSTPGREHGEGKKKKAGKTTKAKASASGNTTTTPKKRASKSFSESFDCDSDDDFQPDTTFKSKGGGGGGRRGGTEGGGEVVRKRGRPPLHRSRTSEGSTPKGKNRPIVLTSDEESEASHHTQKIIRKQSKKSKKRSNSFTPLQQQDSGDSDGGEGVTRNDQQQANLFNVHTFSEWPGQAEGEPMDLPHIWNVISMMFPEDYSLEVSLFHTHTPLITLCSLFDTSSL
jgi:hypothetical protein